MSPFRPFWVSSVQCTDIEQSLSKMKYFIRYPKTGQTAIVASAVPGEAGQLYVHCYNNDSDHTPIASFTPYGKVR